MTDAVDRKIVYLNRVALFRALRDVRRAADRVKAARAVSDEQAEIDAFKELDRAYLILQRRFEK